MANNVTQTETKCITCKKVKQCMKSVDYLCCSTCYNALKLRELVNKSSNQIQFNLNVNMCNNYGADYDGDEMNIFVLTHDLDLLMIWTLINQI